jgi:hypothetical protein
MTTAIPESNHSRSHATDGHTITATLEGMNVKQELARARKAAMKFTDQVIEAGQANPKTAAAILLGTGMLLGSLVYGLFAPRPTAMQVIGRALQHGATSTGRSLLSGLASARKLVA